MSGTELVAANTATPHMIKAVAAAVTLAATAASSGQVAYEQTDWSGGPGTLGPVANWTDTFDASTRVSFKAIPNQFVLTGTPLGTPVQAIVAPDADLPRKVACGDINGDGTEDIVSTDPLYDLSTRRGGVYWWQRTGPEAWVRHTVDDDFYGADHAGVADVDGDGDMDVIACAYYGDTNPPQPLAPNGRYAWFENLKGDGSDWQPHLIRELFHGAEYVNAGDIDGDGDIDILGASSLTDGIGVQDGDIVWFENFDSGGTVWVQHNLDKNFENAHQVHAEDIDGDGDLDVIGAQSGDPRSNFTWWDNVNGNGTTWIKNLIPGTIVGAGYCDLGDIDNDGDVDLIGSAFNQGGVFWWENLDGMGMLWTNHPVGSISAGRALELADLDGDGDLDSLIAAGSTFGTTGWFENNGAGASWTPHTIKFNIDTRRLWITAGDVNDDGSVDAVVCIEDSPRKEVEQISWFDLSRFMPDGELTSSILEVGGTDPWGLISWDVELPTSTEMQVEIRASNSTSNMGPWVLIPSSGEPLASYIDPMARFVQYRASMTSHDPKASPILKSITLTQEPACYADCDPSTGVGVLDIFDFLCFQDAFVAGDPYACDCNTSTGQGVCDIFDFLCFQDAFIAACP